MERIFDLHGFFLFHMGVENWVKLSVTAACWREQEWPTAGRAPSHQTTRPFVEFAPNKQNSIFGVVTRNPTSWRRTLSARSALALLCRWSEECGWVCLWWRRRQNARCPPGICNLTLTYGQRKHKEETQVSLYWLQWGEKLCCRKVTHHWEEPFHQTGRRAQRPFYSLFHCIPSPPCASSHTANFRNKQTWVHRDFNH